MNFVTRKITNFLIHFNKHLYFVISMVSIVAYMNINLSVHSSGTIE